MLRIKVPIYARNDVREVWLIDLLGRRVEIFRDPMGDRYQTRMQAGAGDCVSPHSLPAVILDLTIILN